MDNYCIKGSLIGNCYPMYLRNEGPLSGYLYQIISPNLTEKLEPVITLEKVAEITQKGDFTAKSNFKMMSSDILAYLNGKSRDGILEYLKELVDSDKHVMIDRGEDDFPGFIMEQDASLQKMLIVSLRDALRWKYYKLAPGSKVDVLWDKEHFAVFRIENGEQEDTIRMIPEALYNLKDIGQQWPIEGYTFEGYQPQDFSGKYRASELNRAIKKFEWISFDKKYE